MRESGESHVNTACLPSSPAGAGRAQLPGGGGLMTFLSAERRWRRGVLVLSACLPLAFARLPIAADDAAEPQVPPKLSGEAISLVLDNPPRQTQATARPEQPCSAKT